ncbi:MAG TPA: transporter substrate-binding domain-containing protein [Rhodocyclaceae bacterium]|nr:transporter substrate-binding domain-containing protein [Rhodocyclaceae bacterium]HNB79109.1 transporter substrate-binding domain-containing protein [Rhodocyclaceae bacterium]HNI00639.1 transporter substrate-binding domain-containing protein [Rhodocyclaceae bacterium]
MKTNFLFAVVLAWSIMAGPCGRAAHAQQDGVSPKATPFAACFDPINPPFSAENDANGGIDLQVAEGIAKQLARRFSPVWIQVPNRGGLDKALKQSLLAGKCDAFFGMPLGDDTKAELGERGMAVSSPYVQGRYLLMADPRRAADGARVLRNASRVGALTATPADLYLHKEGLRRVPYGSNKELLAALMNREVDAALVWSPAVARAREDGVAITPDLVVSVQPADPLLATRFVIVTRKGDAQLRNEIDAAIAAMRSSGELAAIMDRNGLVHADPNQ